MTIEQDVTILAVMVMPELGPAFPEKSILNGQLDLDDVESWKPEYMRGRWGRVSDDHFARLVIDEHVKIDPPPNLDRDLDTCNLTLHVGNQKSTFIKQQVTELDLDDKVPQELVDYTTFDEKGFVLHPGDHVNILTREVVGIPDWLIGIMDGKSRLARRGLIIHAAGIIGAGFHGPITLELANVGIVPHRIRPDRPIAVISLEVLTSRARKPYDGKFQGQALPLIT